MNETEFVHSLDSENNLSDIESGDVLGEDLILDEHSHQITTRQELHQHIQEVLVLECREELDHPRRVGLGKNVALGTNVGQLISLEHLRLDQRLHGIDAAINLLLHQLDFAESSLSDNLQSLVVALLILGSQEAKVLGLLSALVGPCLLLSGLGHAWVHQSLLHLVLSVIMLAKAQLAVILETRTSCYAREHA